VADRLPNTQVRLSTVGTHVLLDREIRKYS
jgi:hypothetical protein